MPADRKRRRVRLVRDFAADGRHGFRSLRRSPGLLVVATLSIGLGVGAATTMFAALDAFLLRPAPHLDGLYQLTAAGPGATARNPALAEFEAWRAAAVDLDLVAYSAGGFNLAGEPAERISGARVTAGFYRVAGASPVLGRVFDTSGPAPDDAHAAVLGHDLWQRRFAGDPAVLGRVIHLDGEPHNVIGVMPPGFAFPRSTDEVWTPMPREGEPAAPATVSVIGRAAPEFRRDIAVDRIAAAQAALIAGGLAPPDAPEVRVEPLHERLVTDRLRTSASPLPQRA